MLLSAKLDKLCEAKDDWKKDCKKKGKWDYYPKDEKDFMHKYGSMLRTATIANTMGPLWKPIIWISKRGPLVWR